MPASVTKPPGFPPSRLAVTRSHVKVGARQATHREMTRMTKDSSEDRSAGIRARAEELVTSGNTEELMSASKTWRASWTAAWRSMTWTTRCWIAW